MDKHALIEQFKAESDRAAALLAASYLDECLKHRLLEHFSSRKTGLELLDGPLAPLGSFSSRSKACHALGLIDGATYRDLNSLRNIRNEFGHSWQEGDFDMPKVAKLCRKLTWHGDPEAQAWATPRERFNSLAFQLFESLGN